MRLLVVHRRRVTAELDPAALEARLQQLVADGTLKGRRPVAKGFVWWVSIGPTRFRARYERLRLFLDVSGECSDGSHAHLTDVVIVVTVEVLSAAALLLMCVGMGALLAGFPYLPIGLITLVSIGFGIGLCRSASRHARDFVDQSLVPALAETPRKAAR